MDNQDSTWLNRQGIQRAYPDYGVAKPATPLIAPLAEKIGPMDLNDSQGSLVDRWWIAYQQNGTVVIRGSE